MTVHEKINTRTYYKNTQNRVDTFYMPLGESKKDIPFWFELCFKYREVKNNNLFVFNGKF